MSVGCKSKHWHYVVSVLPETNGSDWFMLVKMDFKRDEYQNKFQSTFPYLCCCENLKFIVAKMNSQHFYAIWKEVANLVLATFLGPQAAECLILILIDASL